MAPLDTRTSRRILALWLAWFGLLAALIGLKARREWQRRASAGPEQHTDLVYSVVVDKRTLLKTILAVVGPPGILTWVWLYLRRRW
jgi:hypothetical protein